MKDMRAASTPDTGFLAAAADDCGGGGEEGLISLSRRFIGCSSLKEIVDVVVEDSSEKADGFGL